MLRLFLDTYENFSFDFYYILRYNANTILTKFQMGAAFIINGGKKLKGTIVTSSGKNAPIALLCASVLVKGKIILNEMSRVEEVDRLIEVLSSIGVKFNWKDDYTLLIDSSEPLQMDKIDK